MQHQNKEMGILEAGFEPATKESRADEVINRAILTQWVSFYSLFSRAWV